MAELLDKLGKPVYKAKGAYDIICGRPRFGEAGRIGLVCQSPAGMGTKHLGEGACYRHGGRAGAPIKTGKYVITDQRFREIYERHLNDPNVYDLRDVVAILKTRLEFVVNDLGKLDEIISAYKAQHLLTKEDADALRRALPTLLDVNIEATIAKLTKTLHEIEVGRKYVVKIEDVNLVLTQVINLVQLHVKDDKVKRALVHDLDNVIVSADRKSLPKPHV